jgi:hypothetical protein
MTPPLDVEKQRFEFSDAWTLAFKYDDSRFYREGPERLKGDVDGVSQSTRAVDVVAIHRKMGILLLEAKDFRGHRIANKKRLTSGEIVVEVALKVRDTIAGLVGADRKSVNEFDAVALSKALGPAKDVTVVLWIEDYDQVTPERAKQQMDTLNQSLKKKLAWLGVKTFVLSSKASNRIPGLTVTDLPGAGQP